MNSFKNIFLRNKTTQQTIVKNTSWLFVAEIGSRLLRFLLVIFAARAIGTAGLGMFSYIMALGGIFMFIEDAGIGMYITRTLVQQPNLKKKLLATTTILKLILLMVALSAFIMLGPTVSSLSEANTLIPVMAIVLLTDSLREFMFTISRAQERMEVESIVKCLTALLVFTCGIVLIHLRPTALSFTWGYAAGGIAGVILIYVYSRNHFENPFSFFSRELIAPIFKAAWPFTILTISNIVIFSTDIFFLGHFSDASTVGAYTAAQRLTQLTYIIPSLLTAAAFPALARKSTGGNGYTNALEKISAALCIIAVPLTIGIALWPAPLLHLFFGPTYTRAALAFIMLALGIFPIFITAVYGTVIFAENKQSSFVVANVTAIVTNIILDLILIPKLHDVGAALAGTISIYIIAIITALRFRSISKFSFFTYVRVGYIALASSAMIAISVLCKHFSISVIVALPLAALIYGVIFWTSHKKEIAAIGIIPELRAQHPATKQ
ncbi:MAG TPA: oligosaccharide flippase family protein [Candidatus Paceibacterota bacterium]|nr:oligosaccharide flippase family protein [Candidatus Paceibacterota bacterium]